MATSLTHFARNNLVVMMIMLVAAMRMRNRNASEAAPLTPMDRGQRVNDALHAVDLDAYNFGPKRPLPLLFIKLGRFA